ncbi:hypothetical protein LCGC14_2822240, partial [marine sediment metagenome]
LWKPPMPTNDDYWKPEHADLEAPAMVRMERLKKEEYVDKDGASRNKWFLDDTPSEELEFKVIYMPATFHYGWWDMDRFWFSLHEACGQMAEDAELWVDKDWDDVTDEQADIYMKLRHRYWRNEEKERNYVITGFCRMEDFHAYLQNPKMQPQVFQGELVES